METTESLSATTVDKIITEAVNRIVTSLLTAQVAVQAGSQDGKQVSQQLSQSVEKAVQEMKQSLQSAGMLSKDVVTTEKSVEDPGTDEGNKVATLSLTRSWNNNDKSLVEDSRDYISSQNRQILTHNKNLDTIQVLELQGLSFLKQIAFAQQAIQKPNEAITQISEREKELLAELAAARKAA